MDSKKNEEVKADYSRANLPIFPQIKAERKGNSLEMETYLRKKHRGKYYLWKFYRSAYVKEGVTNLSPAISSFMRDIYMAMLHGKINPKIKYRPTAEHPEGKPIFPLSFNQDQTEKERLDPNRFMPDKAEPTQNCGTS